MRIKKAYSVILKDGDRVYEEHVPATSPAKAREFCHGNGDIICVNPSERNSSDPISKECICNALSNAHFGRMEIVLILRALNDCEFID